MLIMAHPTWTYMLRILQRNPDRIPMDRLGEYIRQFAELLGTENQPTFKGIKKASTGLKAAIPNERRPYAQQRLLEAKIKPDSRPAKNLRSIEDMLGEDGIKEAQLLDASENIVYLFKGHAPDTTPSVQLYQQGTVDGVVTGLVGADDTMHLHLRDHFDHDLRLVIRDETLARELLMLFRKGLVRVNVHGTWLRTELGWIPETNKCTVDSFEILDDTSPQEIFGALAAIESNGWITLDDPIYEWKVLRGVH
jgi:hypothetical protein